MTWKAPSALISAVVTIVVATCSWAVGQADKVSALKADMDNIKVTVAKIEHDIEVIHKQNTEIQQKLADMLVEHDKRILVLEIGKEEEGKHDGR